MENKIHEGWDVYTHNYEYDEVKVVVYLHDELKERGEIQNTDWEVLMEISHQIYQIYTSQFEDKTKTLPKSWMKIENREEEGYIQAWLARTIGQFADYFKKRLLFVR